MEMAGYRRVNYYELCRLCTSSEGTKMHIFREEGRRRSLPNKIQTCLPLTVQEEDSLPKIICSVCVEKLESYFEFRESCINAEAMLESYFTSLKYSDDLSREGKVSVYVKEEGNKKKEDCTTSKAKPPSQQPMPPTSVSTSSSPPVSSVNVSTSSMQSETVTIPSAIQILTDQDGNRLAHYKVQVQGGIPSLVPTFSSMQMPVQGMQQVKSLNVSQDGNQGTQTDSAPPPLVATVALAPPSHDIYSINKERFRPLTQLAEALRMKNINIIDTSLVDQLNNQNGIPGVPGMQFRIDPEQLQQLMNSGGGLQLNLNALSAVKQDRREKEEMGSQADIDLKFEESEEQALEDEIGEVSEVNDGDGQCFDCDLCGKMFRRKEHLLQHKKSHSGQRPFACSACGKAFSRKEHLLRHKVSHTGQKLYPCEICQKNFSRKDNLHKHKKTHGVTGPYVCPICGKSFVVKHYYTIHKATHDREDKQGGGQLTAFHCDICDKMFSSKHSLEAHKQRHRNKIKMEEASQEEQQQQQQVHHQQQQQVPPQQQTIIASFPMTTINHQSLLTPNILHAGGNMFQLGNGSYVCTPELLDQYRRSQAS